MSKGPDAFRTISEVAEELDLPQHVLRFWETRFTQIRPMKRGGGRRYYRPDDVELLRGIRRLLYGEGYTIKGVQRILKEQGPRQVAMAGQGQLLDPAPPQTSIDEDFADDDFAVEQDVDEDAEVAASLPFDGVTRQEPVFEARRSYPETAPLVRAFGKLGRAPSPPPPSRIPQAPPEDQPSVEDFLPPLVAGVPEPPDRAMSRGRAPSSAEHQAVQNRREPSMAETDRPMPVSRSISLSADATDRLQSVMVELLECKRMLDQAR